MILPFMLLRKYSGGYHLKSSLVCFVSSNMLPSASLMLIKYVAHVDLHIGNSRRNRLTHYGSITITMCFGAVKVKNE